MNEIRSGLKEACPAKKPVVEIERLIDCLLPEAKLVNTQKAGGGNLELINKKETILSVILQLSGEISLLRRVKEDILVATASAPNVFGYWDPFIALIPTNSVLPKGVKFIFCHKHGQ